MPLFINEFSRMALDQGHTSTGVPIVPPIATHRVNIGANSEQGPKWADSTVMIELYATENCCLAFGEDPQADHEYFMMGAGTTRYYGVSSGHRLAVCASGD